MKNFPGSKIATLIHSQQGCEFLKVVDFSIFEVLEEFGEDLEGPSSDKIYSLGNQGVK